MNLGDIDKMRTSANPEEALKLATVALQEAPHDSQLRRAALHLIADCLMDLERYDECVKHCSYIIENRPMDALAYANRGHCQWHLNRCTLALADYEKSISLRADEVRFRHAVSLALVLKRYDKAREYMEMAIKAFPGSAIVKEIQTEYQVENRKRKASWRRYRSKRQRNIAHELSGRRLSDQL